MIIKLLRLIAKYKEKGIKFLPHGTGQEDESKTGIKHIKIFAQLAAPTIKVLQVSSAGLVRAGHRMELRFPKIFLRRFSCQFVSQIG